MPQVAVTKTLQSPVGRVCLISAAASSSRPLVSCSCRIFAKSSPAMGRSRAGSPADGSRGTACKRAAADGWRLSLQIGQHWVPVRNPRIHARLDLAIEPEAGAPAAH